MQIVVGVAWVGTAADAVTVAVALTGGAIALLRPLPSFQRAVLASPLRRSAGRRGREAMVEPERLLTAALRAAVVDAVVHDHGAAPAALLAETLRRAGASRRDGALEPLRRVLGRATRMGTSSIVARLLYPDEDRALRTLLDDLESYLRRFAVCRVVEGRKIGSSALAPGSFAAFASALSGAVVLADAASSRAGFAHDVLVWHASAFRGPGGQEGTTYEQEHEDQGCSAWRPEERPPGDFDLRVLDLRAVALTEAVTEGSLTFVLETTETCYATTELGADDVGCKHVVPSTSADRLGPVVAPATDRPDVESVRLLPDAGRVALLTSYVSVVTADRELLLAKRTGKTRHGRDVLRATAGGVIEPGHPAGAGDRDGTGMPDPLVGVLRETREEIGLDLEAESCRPVSVFLANVRGRTEESRDDGQLVGVVLYLATVPRTSAWVQRVATSRADPARGAWEQEGLETCPLGSPGSAAEWAFANRTRLDQHGLLSVVYACSTLFEPEAVEEAFVDRFDEPWWAYPTLTSGEGRLTRDTRVLVTRPEALLSGHLRRWADAWEHIRL